MPSKTPAWQTKYLTVSLQRVRRIASGISCWTNPLYLSFHSQILLSISADYKGSLAAWYIILLFSLQIYELLVCLGYFLVHDTRSVRNS